MMRTSVALILFACLACHSMEAQTPRSARFELTDPQALQELRAKAWEEYRSGRLDEMTTTLASLGWLGEPELDVANELVRMACEAKARDDYEAASDLGRRVVAILTEDRIAQIEGNATRAQYLELVAKVQQRVLGDPGAAERFYALAVAEDARNVTAVTALEKLRATQLQAQLRGEAAEEEKRDRSALAAAAQEGVAP